MGASLSVKDLISLNVSCAGTLIELKFCILIFEWVTNKRKCSLQYSVISVELWFIASI